MSYVLSGYILADLVNGNLHYESLRAIAPDIVREVDTIVREHRRLKGLPVEG